MFPVWMVDCDVPPTLCVRSPGGFIGREQAQSRRDAESQTLGRQNKQRGDASSCSSDCSSFTVNSDTRSPHFIGSELNSLAKNSETLSPSDKTLSIIMVSKKNYLINDNKN